METTDCIVIGAGVIGLAVARALTLLGRDVVILERANSFGTETSSRNSEVIHAGIYYAHGSLMARMCVAGRKQLYQFCEDYAVPHRQCGKLIVAAAPSETEQLLGIKARAETNGVLDIQQLSAGEARLLEPELQCYAALLSPSTGIIDSHAFMQALLGDAQSHGAVLALNTEVVAGTAVPDGMVIETGGGDATKLHCKICINAAGLHAPLLAGLIGNFPSEMIPSRYFAKGTYFSLSGRSPFSRLIYPLPMPGGLGTHLTLDLAGQARFGPDVEWVNEINYEVDPARANTFYGAIRRYWPGLKDGELVPAYAGIRPKIVPPAVAKQDFMIQGPRQHGCKGLVNLFGIESPGLTASLALADYVVDILPTD